MLGDIMRVLVTRPQPQGEILCQQIRECGWEAIYFPTIFIEPILEETDIKPIMQKLDQYNWLIFISPQAVYYAQKWLHQYWPILPKRIKIAAVGLGTAQALQENGFSVVVYPATEWNSEGLLALPQFQQINGQKCLIVQGEGGRDLLVKTLLNRLAEVEQLIVYRRILPKIDSTPYLSLLQNKKIDIIICTSMEGMRNLILLIGEENKHYILTTVILVVSQRLKDYALSLGFEQVWLANNAQNETILKVLGENK
jgi:uroporphyrinogen-III synthase